MLPLQERLRISAVRLLHAHDVTSLVVSLAAGIEGRRRPLDLNLAETKQLQHLSRRPWIRLGARNNERIWRRPRNGPASHFIEIPEQIATPRRRLVQTALERNQLIVDDVPQPPGAAFPRLKIIPASL